MKRSSNRVRQNRSAEAAARQVETVNLRLRRRFISDHHARIQFLSAETGRMVFSTIVPRAWATAANGRDWASTLLWICLPGEGSIYRTESMIARELRRAAA